MLEDLNGNYPGVTLENIQAIERLRHKLIKSENDLDDAQEEVKRLKKKVNSVQQDINRVNGMLVDRQNYMNLKSDDVATSEDPPKPGEHREVSIAVLANHSAPHAVIEALNDEGVQTFDQLEEWLANNERPKLKASTAWPSSSSPKHATLGTPSSIKTRTWTLSTGMKTSKMKRPKRKLRRKTAKPLMKKPRLKSWPLPDLSDRRQAASEPACFFYAHHRS